MSQAGETRLQSPEATADGGQAFFTSVGCMDGRVQEPIWKFGQKKFGAKYADTITEAGLVGLLSKKQTDKHLLQSLKKKILISIEKHYSKGIVIHGHEECARNPVNDEQHKKDTLKAAKVIQSFVPKGAKIIPVFVERENNTWIVEEL